MTELYLLWQIKHFRSHLRHRYSDTVNQVIITTVNVRSNNFNTINRNPWISGYLVLYTFDVVHMWLFCFQNTDIHRAKPSNISFVKFI
jgi:hypothetical protein